VARPRQQQQRRQRQQQQQRYEPVPVDTGTVDEEDAGSTAEEVVEMDEDTLEVEVDKDTLLAAGVVAAVQELEARSVSEETESFRPGEWRRQDKKRRSAAAVSAGDEAAKAWAAQLAIELEADASARARLEAAVREKDVDGLRAALAAMEQRGLADLEYDARDLDAAKALLSSLEMSRERA